MNKVTFNFELCKGCRLCVLVCPKKIIAMDTSTLNKKGYHPSFVKEQEKCIACTMCAVMCPDAVITVEKNVKEK